MKRTSMWVFAAIAFIACGGGGAGDVGSGAADGGALADGGVRDGAGDAVTKGDGSAGGACHADGECKAGFEICVAPGQPQCGGEARPEVCANDNACADAGVDLVCVPATCGGSSCRPKCTSDAQCTTVPAGLQTCNLASGHCEVKTCTASSCPVDYTCSSNAAEGCVRKACTSDGECSGACVNQRCWSGAGVCMGMPS